MLAKTNFVVCTEPDLLALLGPALALLSYKRRKQILSNNLTEMRDLGKEDYPYQ